MSEGQPDLFDREQPNRPPAGDIVLHPQPGRSLSKAQQAFNRLVARIEKLRAKLERERRRLDEALAYYGQHLHPRRQRLAALRKEMVRVLAPFLEDKRLKSKRDREALRSMLADQLEQVAGAEDGGLDDDLKALFERIHGVSAEQAAAEGTARMRSAMESMFGELGIDIDLSDFHPDMSAADLAAKVADVQEQIRRQSGQAEAARPPERRKTKRQLEKEERERLAVEMREKSIATIYKQLAKVLHPDLEQDPERKRGKSALMQELTAAYRNNDLHTLLRLELEWIHREEADLARLTDEKLGVYNLLLKEQVAELEREVFELPHDPRYRPLATPAGPFSMRIQADGPAEAFRLDMVIQSIEDSLDRLRSGEALQEVRGAIREFHAAQRRPDFGAPF